MFRSNFSVLNPSVLSSITHFLLCRPMQKSISFPKSNKVSFRKFSLTLADKKCLFLCTVPVIFVYLDNKNSHNKQQCTNYGITHIKQRFHQVHAYIVRQSIFTAIFIFAFVYGKAIQGVN